MRKEENSMVSFTIRIKFIIFFIIRSVRYYHTQPLLIDRPTMIFVVVMGFFHPHLHRYGWWRGPDLGLSRYPCHLINYFSPTKENPTIIAESHCRLICMYMQFNPNTGMLCSYRAFNILKFNKLLI